MSRFQGLIDFSRLPRHAGETATARGENGLDRIDMPGLELRWDPGAASVAASDELIALVAGRPRMAETQAMAETADDAAAWIARYRTHGERAAAEVGGGFCAVIVDLGRQRAVLWVDRFSIETICYRADNGTLGFADSCRDVPGSRLEIDAQAISDYLYFHVIPAPETVFRDVRRVVHAHRVVADGQGARSEAYWVPDFDERNHHDLAGRKRDFLSAVEHSVAEEADEPMVACFLSGGTDSSTVAGMLTRVRGTPAHCYSIGFESEGYDEMEYARIAARHFGLVHHEYYVTPDDLVAAIPKVAASFDQPFGNSSVLPAYYCALRAREDGFSRMLAGDGGDELYGGNSRYATQKVFELYQLLPGAFRRRVLEPPALDWPLFRQVPGFRQAGGYVRHSRVPMPDRMETFNLLHRFGLASVLAPDLLAGVDSAKPIEHQRATWNAIRDGSLVNRMLAYDWKYTLADSDLPKVRGATRLAGVSVGYPFLSRELTDLSLGVPPDWKVRRLKLRWFFKEALREFLPQAILTKKKHGFGLPFGPWSLRHPALREMAVSSLDHLVHQRVARQEFVRDLVDRRLPEAPGYYGEMVWVLMMLAQWLRATGRPAL